MKNFFLVWRNNIHIIYILNKLYLEIIAGFKLFTISSNSLLFWRPSMKVYSTHGWFDWSDSLALLYSIWRTVPCGGQSRGPGSWWASPWWTPPWTRSPALPARGRGDYSSDRCTPSAEIPYETQLIAIKRPTEIQRKSAQRFSENPTVIVSAFNRKPTYIRSAI